MLSETIAFLKSPKRFNTRIARELFWVALGQVLLVVGGIVSVRVLTSALGAAEYGSLALVQTLVVFPALLLYGPISQGVARYYIVASERDRRVELIAAIAGLLLASTALAAVIAAAIVSLSWNPSWYLRLGGVGRGS